MPKGAGTNEGPGADPGEEQAAGTPHADIVERLLEYQRLLREETEGETPTFGAVRDALPSTDVEPDPVEPSAESRTDSKPEPPAEAEPKPVASADVGSEPPEARRLQERIARLDETLARISAMLPLLRGADDREQDP
jgi:hypothetical protein